MKKLFLILIFLALLLGLNSIFHFTEFGKNANKAEAQNGNTGNKEGIENLEH